MTISHIYTSEVEQKLSGHHSFNCVTWKIMQFDISATAPSRKCTTASVNVFYMYKINIYNTKIYPFKQC